MEASPQYMEVLKLRFRDAMVQGPYFHLTTVEWARNRLPGYHTHDYDEIFWILSGRCEHLINGRREVIEPGALVLMRADDCHQLRAIRNQVFRFTNLAISPQTTRAFMARYPQEHKYLYASSNEPLCKQLSQGQLEILKELVRDLAAGPHSCFAIERVVMNIWNLLLPQRNAELRHGPPWLADALLQIEEEELLSGGLHALVKLAGRTHAHVTRECKRHLGKTPTAVLTEIRLRHASKLLRMTSKSVLEVSGDCGFDNPAHFHRLFKREFGTTPRKYRDYGSE